MDMRFMGVARRPDDMPRLGAQIGLGEVNCANQDATYNRWITA